MIRVVGYAAERICANDGYKAATEETHISSQRCVYTGPMVRIGRQPIACGVALRWSCAAQRSFPSLCAPYGSASLRLRHTSSTLEAQ